MSSAKTSPLPQHRNLDLIHLLQYRQPAAAVVSILHRISGLLLFLALPLFAWLLQKSLISPLSFAEFRAALVPWWARAILLVLLWAWFHHVAAGLRFLWLDLSHRTDKVTGKRTALGALVFGLVLTLLCAAQLFAR